MRKITQKFLFLLVTFLCCVGINVNAETLTVGRGSATNQYLPIYGLYADTKNTHGQVIYLADSLTEVAGGEISKLTFYLSTPATAAWSGATFQVSLGETTSSSLGSGFISSDLTVVYTGSLDPTQSTMDVEFATPFSYEGGNLVVDFLVTVAGTYKSATFAGASVSNAGRFYYSASEQCVSFIPKVTVEYTSAVVACPKPGMPSVEAIATNSATLTWSAGGEETQWQYLCVPAADEPDWAQAELSSETQKSYDELLENTPYIFYLRAYCGTDEQSTARQLSFRTACDVKNIPWNESFEDTDAGSSSSSNVPDCWSLIASGGSNTAVFVASSAASEGSKSLRFETSSSVGNQVFALLPVFDDLSNAQISFSYRNENATSGGLISFGYLTDISDTMSFHALQTCDRVTSWTNVSDIELTSVPAGAILAFRLGKTSSSWYYAYVDNVEIKELPQCRKPTDLVVSAINASGATFSWVAGADEQMWQYLVIPSGDTPNWDEAGLVDEAGIVIEDELEALTNYDFYVRAYCSDEEGDQSDARSISFRTACDVNDAATWADDFESGIECWIVGNKQNPTGSYVPYISSTYAKSTSHSLYMSAFYASYSSNDSAYAILPELDFGDAGIQAYSLAFAAKSSSSSSNYNQHILVGVLDDVNDFSTFTLVQDVQVTTTFEDFEVNFAAYEGAGTRIALLAIAQPLSGSNTTGYGTFYVDDVATFVTPSCQSLASISISDIARRSMLVKLHAKNGSQLSNSYELVCSASELDEQALEAAEKVMVNDTNAYLISGLERETPYYIYMRANCGSENGVSDWVSAQATTKGLNACVDSQIGTGTSEANLIYTSYGNTYSQHIYTADELIAAGYTAGPISALAFNYTGSSSNYDKTQSVYIGAIEADAFVSSAYTSFISGLQLVYGPTLLSYQAGWRSYEFTTPFIWDGQSNIVVAMLTNSSSTSASGWSAQGTSVNAYRTIYRYKDSTPIDIENLSSVSSGSYSTTRPNIKFTMCYALDPCPAVSNLACELIGEGTSEAVVRWNIAGADYLSGYDVILSESEIADFEGLEPTFANIQVDSIDLQGLSASTHYYVYIRAICKAEGHDEGNSTWVSIDFETLADCPTVINLQAYLLDLNKAGVAWELAFEGQEKHFQYVLSTEELDDAALEAASHIAVDDTTYIQLADLAYEQEYHLYVASVCGSAHSAYSHISFTTLPVCQAVDSLLATRVEHNRVELTWESPEFATAEQWEVGIVGDEALAQIVRDRHAILFGLNAETPYQAYVKAICSETESSAIAVVDFTTAAQPGDCILMGTGTSTAKYPFTNYNYAYSQTIYPASELQSGNILSLRLQRSSGTAQLDNVKIYLGTTDKSSFAVGSSSYYSSDWVAEDDLTLVYDGSIDAAESAVGEDVIILDAPFAYNGQSNLVLAVSHKIGVYSNIHNYYYTTVSNTFLSRSNDNDESYANYPSAQGSLSSSRANIQFCFEPKACRDVTALAVSEITTSSAKITWEPMGAEMAWNVFISSSVVQDFSDLSAYNVIRAESLGFVFDELNDDTDYFVYVQPADCEGADFSMISFRTVASCLVMQSPAVVAESIAAHTARVAWIDPNETPAGQYTVAYAKYDDFDLNGENILTVQVTDTFADLSALQADTVYRFAVMANCGGNDASRYSAVAQFTTLQSCFAPTSPNVLAESISSNSATVYWVDEHDDAGYIVAYGEAASFDINNSETYLTKNVSDTFAILDNLVAATTYRFMVKGDCSEDGEGVSKSWTWSQTFTTACITANLPFSQNFNTLTSGIPACWDNSEGTTTDNSYKWSYYATGTSGACVRFNSYSNSNNRTNILATPTIHLSEDAQLSFACKNPAGGAFSVQISADGAARADLLTGLTGISSWEEKVVDLSAYTGQDVVIYFCATSNYGSGDAYIYLDDVEVSAIPSCVKPASVNAPTAVSENEATFSWVAGGDEADFQYVIVPAGVTPDWSNAVDVIGATSVTVQGLVASTAYDFYVRANCGEGEENKSEARSISFRTVCASYVVDAENSFNEGFEENDFAPSCWDLVVSATHQWTRNTSATNVHSGNASAYSGFYGDVYLVMPPLAIANNQGNVELTFWSYNTWVTDYNKNSVVLLGESEQELWSPVSVAQEWAETTINLNDYKGQTIKLAFKYEGDNDHGWYVDDVQVAFSSTPSAIKDVKADGSNIVKLIIGDHFFIIRDGVWYDAMGHKVEAQR